VHARLSYPLCPGHVGRVGCPAAAQAPATQAPQVTVSGVAYLQYLYHSKTPQPQQQLRRDPGVHQRHRTVLRWRLTRGSRRTQSPAGDTHYGTA